MAQTDPLPHEDEDGEVAPAHQVAAARALIARWREICGQEALGAVRIDQVGERRAAIAPWGERERILFGGEVQLPLPREDLAVDEFLRGHGAGELIYGYPVYVDQAGHAWPLFSLPARIEETPNGVIAKFDRQRPPVVNIALMREIGVAETDIAALLGELAGASSTFADPLSRVCGRIGIDTAMFDPADLDANGPADCDILPIWINRPMLAEAASTMARTPVLRSLDLLAQDQELDRALTRSALLAMLNPAEPPDPDVEEEYVAPDDRPVVFEQHPSGASQRAAVLAGLDRPLSLVAAPPGTGQMATVVNLIATAILERRSVLYVSARAETARAMARHIDSLVSSRFKSVLRLTDWRGMQACRDEILASLIAIARAEAADEDDDAPAEKSKRSKPTRQTVQKLERLPPPTEGVLEPVRELHAGIEAQRIAHGEAGLALGRHWSIGDLRHGYPPAPAKTLAAWRARLTELTSEDGAGLGKRLMGVLSKGSDLQELAAEIKAATRRLDEDARADIAADLGDGNAAGIEAALNRLQAHADWRALGRGWRKSVEQLGRLRDSRSLELQALNQSARKVHASRELFRDAVYARVTDDLPRLERQVAVFFDMLERQQEVRSESSKRQIDSQLAQAVAILSESLPLWVGTAADIEHTMPLKPGYFDLVIVDEADRLSLGDLLPALFRAKRALAIGAEGRDARVTPLLAGTGAGEARADLPAWAADPARGALAGLREGHGDSDNCLRLTQHFRSHPFVAQFLAQAFYDGEIEICSPYRQLRQDIDPGYLGIHWYDVAGETVMTDRGRLNATEVGRAYRLLHDWHKAGLFDEAPRRSVGVVGALPLSLEELREQLAHNLQDEALVARVTIGPPGLFVGKQVDMLILMTGLGDGAGDDGNLALARDRALYHDAVGAARLGLHIIGDRAVAESVGHFPAEISYCTGPSLVEPGEPERPKDQLIERFEQAFQQQQQDGPHPLDQVAEILDAIGLPYQRQVQHDGHDLAIRVLTPHGGRYNIELAGSMEDKRAEAVLAQELKRDETVGELGYIVVRLAPEDFADKDALNARLERLL